MVDTSSIYGINKASGPTSAYARRQRVTYRPLQRNASGQLVGGSKSTVPNAQYKSWSEGLGRMEPGAANWFPGQIDWRTAYGNAAAPQMPMYPNSPGNGGGGGGGGYGGGGGLTAEQQQAMARLMDPALMSFSAFVPPEARPRDTAVFNAARKRIGSARDADVAFAQDQGRQLMALLAGQQNVMANPRMTQTPQMNQAYQRIVGGDPANAMVGDVINAENAYSQNSDGAFANLMAVLAAQEGRNMQSRQREAMNDQGAILNAIRAQASGMLGGVDMADIQDAKAYGQRMEDRDFNVAYNNYLAQQGVNQGNVGIQNDWAQAIMDLIPMLTDAGVLAQIGA